MTDKQKKILKAGIGLRKIRGNDMSKDFIDIIEDTLSAQAKSNLLSALKIEVIARRSAEKSRLENEITDLSA